MLLIAVTNSQTSRCCSCTAKGMRPASWTLLAGKRSTLCTCCSYATTDESVLELYSKADAFNKLSAAATKVAQQQAEMPAGDVASMYIALLGFTGKVYPDKLDFTDKVLTECYQVTASLHSLPFYNRQH